MKPRPFNTPSNLTHAKVLAWCLLLLATFSAIAPKALAADTNSVSATDPQAPVDIRIMVDVSGSVQRHDPQGARFDALRLLLRLLPRDGLAGIWSFAGRVSEVVPHAQSDLFWQRDATIRVQGLSRVAGERSDLAAALLAGSFDQARSGGARHIILLTDGVFDLASDAVDNRAARQRLLTQTLPKLKTAGYRVHTLALSEQGDLNLLRQLSALTDGLHSQVNDLDALEKALTRMLDLAAQTQRLPVARNEFVVEPGLREVLLWRGGGDWNLTLIRPDGQRVTRATPSTAVRWFDAKTYDVISITEPMPGRWRFADVAADSAAGEVLAYSELRVVAESVPPTLLPGRMQWVDFDLQHGTDLLRQGPLNDLLQPSAALQNNEGERPLYVERLASGSFRAHLLELHETGDHLLKLTLEGPTFARQLNVPFTVTHPVRVELAPRADGAGVDVLTSVHQASLDFDSLRVAAQLRRPPAPRRLVPAQKLPGGLWQIAVEGSEGIFEVALILKGNYLNNKSFSLKTKPITASLNGAARSYSFGVQGRPVERPPETVQGSSGRSDAEIADGQPSSADSTQSAAQSPAAAPEPQPELLLPYWFVGVIAGVNLLLVGGLWWLLARAALPHALSEALAARRAQLLEAAAAS